MCSFYEERVKVYISQLHWKAGATFHGSQANDRKPFTLLKNDNNIVFSLDKGMHLSLLATLRLYDNNYYLLISSACPGSNFLFLCLQFYSYPIEVRCAANEGALFVSVCGMNMIWLCHVTTRSFCILIVVIC